MLTTSEELLGRPGQEDSDTASTRTDTLANEAQRRSDEQALLEEHRRKGNNVPPCTHHNGGLDFFH